MTSTAYYSAMHLVSNEPLVPESPEPLEFDAGGEPSCFRVPRSFLCFFSHVTNRLSTCATGEDDAYLGFSPTEDCRFSPWPSPDVPASPSDPTKRHSTPMSSTALVPPQCILVRVWMHFVFSELAALFGASSLVTHRQHQVDGFASGGRPRITFRPSLVWEGATLRGARRHFPNYTARSANSLLDPQLSVFCFLTSYESTASSPAGEFQLLIEPFAHPVLPYLI